MCNIGNTVTTGQESQEIPTPAIFQTDDLDAFDSDCDEAPSTSAVLMAKLSAYDSNVLSEVPNHDTYLDNHMIDQNVQEMQYSEQPPFINDPDIDITNDSNVILYEQYLKETENEVVQDTPSSTQQDATIMSVIEEMSNQVAKCNGVNKENKTVNESLTAEFERYKEQIKISEERPKLYLNDKKSILMDNYVSHKTLSTTIDVLKKVSKAKEDKYLEEIIDLKKKKEALDNVLYKMGQLTKTMHMLTNLKFFTMKVTKHQCMRNFIIPNGVLVDIEQCMRNFLWSPGASLKGKAKVDWDVVCLPKDEGGLGIRRLDHFNSALMVSHIWKLLSLKESLWVKWIHAYKLCGRNFWDIPLRGNMSWGWRKILQLRPIVREFIWHKVGNGSNTSLWYDRWCAASPLANHVSNRDVFRAGLSLSSCISDIVAGNVWNWPSDLIDKYPLLNSCKVPLSSEVDSLEWRLHDGAVKNFSISQVWSNIRPRDVKVPWYHMVWFPLSIPRHAFHMWLIVKRKLKTQDRINPWDVVSSLGITCSLCDDVPDSHEHLFFNCSYASAVWNHMKHRADLGHVLHDVYAIIDHFGDSAKRKSSRVVIAKLVVAASAYFIWQERNWRLFKGTKRSVQQVIDCIVSAVRLKLLTCRFKRSKDGSRYARLWDLPDSIFR
ncbi:reverse transcriptase zinc-binding domain-containing protein [Tanacetum coccineum]